MCVVGSIDELGNWLNYKCKMKWTPGHVWQMEMPLILRDDTRPFFNYKYVLMEHEKMIRWESGVDRIADLRILQPISHF